MGRKGENHSKSVTRKDHSQKLAVQMQTADLLDAGSSLDAVKLVCDYEMQQPRPRGMGVNWASGTEGLARIKAIYSSTPWFLENVPPSSLADVRLVAAMDELWGERVKIFPNRHAPIDGCRFDLGTAARQLQFHEANKAIVAEASQLSLPSKIEYLAAQGDCEACQARNGRHYTCSKAPEIPSRDCKCDTGCRCILAVVIDDDLDA